MNVLDTASSDGRLGYFDFDSPTATIDNLGSSIPLDLEGMVAMGDSGGGWFSLQDGKWVLSHITSGIWANLDGVGDGGYGDIAMGVRLATHWDWISATMQDIWGPYSTAPQLTTAGADVPMVTGLAGAALSQTAVRLSWVNSGAADGYAIYRGGVRLGVVTGGSYDDAGLAVATTYSYEVAAVVADREGVRSEPVLVATAGADATSLTVFSPSEVTFSEPGLFLFEGRIGGLFQGRLYWRNSLTGVEEMVEVAEDWSVMLPVGIGLNRFTFRAVTAEGEVVTRVAPDVMVPGDLDGDGIDDWWEMLHFGSIEACEPDEDPDGDGFSNRHEWKLGTLPLDASSRFEVTIFEWMSDRNEPTVWVSWNTVPGTTYRVMGSYSLRPQDWFLFDIFTDSSPRIWVDPGSVSAMYSFPEGTKQFFLRVELLEESVPMAGHAVGGAGAAMQPTAAVQTAQTPDGVTVVADGEKSAAETTPTTDAAAVAAPPAAAEVAAQVETPEKFSEDQTASQGETMPTRWPDNHPVSEPAMRVVQKMVRAERPRESTVAEPEPVAVAPARVAAVQASAKPAPFVAAVADHAAASAPISTTKKLVSGSSEFLVPMHAAGMVAPHSSLDDSTSAGQPASVWRNMRQWWESLMTWLKGFLLASIPSAE